MAAIGSQGDKQGITECSLRREMTFEYALDISLVFKVMFGEVNVPFFFFRFLLQKMSNLQIETGLAVMMFSKYF